MTLRASTDPSRGQGRFPGGCETLEPGEETSVHGYGAHEAPPAGPLASPERSKVRAAALTGVRA